MSLIAYAGYDPTEKDERRDQALILFRSGMDTWALAKYFHITEATAHRWINEERSREHHLRAPYRETDYVE